MYTAIIFLLAQLLRPGLTAVHFTERVTIPKHGSDTITIKYDELFPGKRSAQGGCYFMDVTNKESKILIIEDKPDHVTVRGVRRHTIEWHCNWNVPDPNYKGPK